jgi:hypothetical protein
VVVVVPNNWANDCANKALCALSHSGGPYGENIFWSSGVSTPAADVTAWVNEKQFYNYASNSCTAGKVCGHYIHVLHSGTMHVFGPILGSEIFIYFHRWSNMHPGMQLEQSSTSISTLIHNII